MAHGLDNLKPEIEEMDQLGHLIERHVRKEERVLFQQLQELFTEEAMDQLRKLLSGG
jgi:hemerythrin-like domain-containing protein